MENKPQRNFIIGDEWLFYKIYCGPKSAELILTNVIAPIANQLLRDGVIEKWFFIRYGDPEYHLRIRFHYLNQHKIGFIINTLQLKLKGLFNQDLIAKIQIDTYQREIERYGLKSIELSEIIFYHDSDMIVQFINAISGDEGEEYRWLFSLRAIDSHLESFKFTLREKQNLINHLKSSYRKEYDESKFLGKQLNDKYRKYRSKIDAFMDDDGGNGSIISNFITILEEKKDRVEPIVDKILNLKISNQLEVDFNSLNSSYIHMLMNRLFKSKNRLHEMVCYDFLNRYYMSKIAREKHR